MKKSRKVTMEQVAMDRDGKKITLEQSIEDIITNTPHWDRMKNNVKNYGAKDVTIFTHSFIHSLLPSFIIVVLMFLGIFLMC